MVLTSELTARRLWKRISKEQAFRAEPMREALVHHNPHRLYDPPGFVTLTTFASIEDNFGMRL